MKLSELQKLDQGSEIIHKRYGLCIIREIIYSFGSFFGVLIQPKTEAGKAQLALDCKCDITDFMEDSLRRVSILTDSN